MTDEFLILLTIWIVPCGFLIALGYGRAWWRQRKRLRVPVTEKLLRGPGESLRKQLEKIEDQLSDELTLAFMLPLAFGGFIQALQHGPKPPFGHINPWVMAGLGCIAYGVICRRLLRLLEKKRRHRLGLIGERAVGEELNHLMRRGAHVFHDVPGTYGNVDHVVVAPSGVFAVETKTWQKREAAGTEAHRVLFDGGSLRFAGWNQPDDRCLQQAQRQASQLGDWLSKAVGEPVRVPGGSCPARLVCGASWPRSGVGDERQGGSQPCRRTVGAERRLGRAHRPPTRPTVPGCGVLMILLTIYPKEHIFG